jgi:hypothetical protein
MATKLSAILGSNFQGTAATINVGTVTTTGPTTNPTVTNAGTEVAALLDFGIPRAATVGVGTTSAVNPNVTPSVSNGGSGGDVLLNFSLPSAPTVSVASVTTVNPNVNPSGSNTGTNGNLTLSLSLPRAAAVSLGSTTIVTPATSPSVTNSGSNGDVVLNFSLPTAPTISLASSTTLNPNQSPTLTDSGSSGNVALNFGIPRAATIALNATPVVTVGPTVNPSITNSGTNGDSVLQFSIPRAATVLVGTVTTLEPGNSAEVSNSGSSGDVVLDFSIPRGPRGVIPRGVWEAATAYDLDDLATYNGATYRRIVAGTSAGFPPVDGTNWEVFAAAGSIPTAYVIDDLSNKFNARRLIFDLNVNGSSAGVTQAQDLTVIIGGRFLTPDVTANKVTYPWFIVTGLGGLGKDYKIINNKLVFYVPPRNGEDSYVLYRPSAPTNYVTGNYPFSAMTIALGD